MLQPWHDYEENANGLDVFHLSTFAVSTFGG